MKNTKHIGNITELNCLAAFLSEGYDVSIPYGDCARYDFIADINGKLIRVQTKTASPLDKKHPEIGIHFSCRSKNIKYKDNEIDYFTTYWKNICYLIPVNECSAIKNLRFKKPKNGQKHNITYAEHYQLHNMLNLIK